MPFQQKDYPLMTVVIVAMACMGSVSIFGGIYTLVANEAPLVACSVIIPTSNPNERHEYVGVGKLW